MPRLFILLLILLITAAALLLGIWLLYRHRNLKSAGSSIDVCNLHAIGKRTSQQDSFCISDFQKEETRREKGMLAVLADGMGGLSHGAQMSALITSSVLYDFESVEVIEDEGAFLDDLLSSLLNQVTHFTAKNKELCGSTLLLAWIYNEHMYYRSIGDSRIYLCRDQQLVQINREHTYGQQLDEAALLSGDWQSAVDEQRNAVTSYLGMGQEKLQVDGNANYIKLFSEDVILLCSDGVFHTLQQEELLKAVYEGTPCDICARLQKQIDGKHKQKQDNYTAIVIAYKQKRK